MGYLFTLLSVLSGNIKGYCGKKTSNSTEKFSNAIYVNVIRMIFCIIIGLVFILFKDGIGSLVVNAQILLITLLSGTSTSLFVVFWLISVRKGAYMMIDIFLMLGVVIPIVGCIVFFGEKIKATQIIGLIILISAVFIMCSYNTSLNGKMTLSSLILLIVCGVSNGLTDFSQKLFVNYGNGTSAAVFNFYTYAFSAILLFIFYMLFGFKSSTRSEEKTLFKNIGGYIFIMSVCLFLNSYFKTMAANYLSSSELYPLSQGLSLIFSSIMSAVFFKEKITLKCVIGMFLAFIALIIINIF